MRSQSSRAVWGFMHVYQIAVHTHLTNHKYFDHGKKPQYLQLELQAWIWDLRSISVAVTDLTFCFSHDDTRVIIGPQ